MTDYVDRIPTIRERLASCAHCGECGDSGDATLVDRYDGEREKASAFAKSVTDAVGEAAALTANDRVRILGVLDALDYHDCNAASRRIGKALRVGMRAHWSELVPPEVIGIVMPLDCHPRPRTVREGTANVWSGVVLVGVDWIEADPK